MEQRYKSFFFVCLLATTSITCSHARPRISARAHIDSTTLWTAAAVIGGGLVIAYALGFFDEPTDWELLEQITHTYTDANEQYEDTTRTLQPALYMLDNSNYQTFIHWFRTAITHTQKLFPFITYKHALDTFGTECTYHCSQVAQAKKKASERRHKLMNVTTHSTHDTQQLINAFAYKQRQLEHMCEELKTLLPKIDLLKQCVMNMPEYQRELQIQQMQIAWHRHEQTHKKVDLDYPIYS